MPDADGNLTPYERGRLRATRQLAKNPEERALASELLGEPVPENFIADSYPVLDDRRPNGPTYRET